MPGIRLYNDNSTPTPQGGGIRLYAPGQEYQPPTQVKPQPFLGGAVDFVQTHFPSTQHALQELNRNPLSLGVPKMSGPDSVASKFVSAFTTPVKNFVQKSKELFNTPAKDMAGSIGKDLELISAGAGIAFSPLSALFQAANDVPLLGSVSRGINLGLSAIGEAGSGLSGTALDKVPDSIISKAAKDKIRPGLQEIGALAAQMIIGGKATEMVLSPFKIAELKKTFSNEDIQTIIKQTQDFVDRQQATGNVQMTPKAPALQLKSGEPAGLLTGPKSNYISGEGFTATDKPNLDIVKQTKAINAYNDAVAKFVDKPTPATLKKVLEAKALKDNFTPSNQPQTSGVRLYPETTPGTPNDMVNSAPTSPKTAPGEAIPGNMGNIPNNGNNPSGTALDLNQRVIEMGLLKKGEAKIAEFQGSSYEEQKVVMERLMQDVENVKKIIKGEVPLPSEARSAKVLDVMEEYAKATKDSQLAYDLVNSPLHSAISRGASETSFARLLSDSVSKALNDVANIRKEKVSRTLGKAKLENVKKTINIEAEKSVLTAKENFSLQKFLDEIIC